MLPFLNKISMHDIFIGLLAERHVNNAVMLLILPLNNFFFLKKVKTEWMSLS